MVHGILISAADSSDLVPYEPSRLEDYQSAVGGWIEAVDLPEFGCTLFVNEEGLIRGLPFNRRATFLWWFHVPAVRGRAQLVGDALLVGLPNQGGASTCVPEAAQRAMLGENLWDAELKQPGTTRWRRDPSGGQAYIEAVVWGVLVSEFADAEIRIVPRN